MSDRAGFVDEDEELQEVQRLLERRQELMQVLDRQMRDVRRLAPELGLAYPRRQSRPQSALNDVQRRFRGVSSRSTPEGRRAAAVHALITAI